MPGAGRKIFGVGLNKTGTSTLGTACRILGLRVVGFSRQLLLDVRLRNDFSRVFEVTRQNDVFEDWPWPLIYKELDREFPSSGFILLTRKNPQAWLNSLKRHSMTTHPFRHSRKMAYGHNYPHGREREHIEIYERHNQEVRDYFKHRPGDLVELCWEKGDGWDELCAFLGMEVPPDPFPHSAKGGSGKKRPARRVVNRLLSAARY